ncbi:MAG: hypothetical protein ACRDNZ_11505 [Streptosporangiaceae bacterium]
MPGQYGQAPGQYGQVSGQYGQVPGQYSPQPSAPYGQMPQPRPLGGRQGSRLGRRGMPQIVGGAGLLAVGLLITIFTYGMASSSPSGGFYFVASGRCLPGRTP